MIDLKKYTKSQKQAVLHDSGNLLVSASAGSGKTMVIIDRIVRLITENKAKVDEILAMTFTKAAASEMKEKLKKALLKEFNETGDLKLKKQLDRVNASSISTIHSFCGDLIKKYFYLVGLDASFEVVDEKKANKLASEAIDNLFSKLYEERDKEFLDLLSIYSVKRKDYELRKIVLSLYYFAESEGSIEKVYSLSEQTHLNIYPLMVESSYKLCKNLLLDSERFIDLAIDGFKTDKKRKEFALLIKNHIQTLKLVDDVNYVYDCFKEINTKLPQNSVIENEATSLLKEGHALFKESKKALSILEVGDNEVAKKAQRGLSVLKALVNLAVKFREEFSKTKLENNAVDFSDLQKYALILLKDENVLNEVKSKYKYVFIDEYQDVNDVQESLVSLISNENVFMVGDSKQNIYAFRGCDTKYFTEKYKNYENNLGGRVLDLDYNFRSAPEIIKVVNNLFKSVFTEDFCKINYEKSPMIYGELYNGYQGKVLYHLIEDKKEELTKTPEDNKRGVYSVIEDCKPNFATNYGEEEALVTKLITDIVGTPYYDIKEKDESKRYKNFTFGDICILTRSNGRLIDKILSALLSCDIPVSLEGKHSIGGYPEVKVLISLISAICQINQDIPLATIMLNMWDFTDEELCEIRQIGGKKNNFYSCVKRVKEKGGELGEKISGFLKDFEELRLISEFVSANEVLNRAVSKTDWDAKLLSQPYGKQKLKRVERFIAESASVDGKMNVKDFNDYILKSIDDIKIAESTGEDTVKIITEHSSKGLEYPCVIIVGCDVEYNSQDVKTSVIMDRNYGVSTRIYDAESMTFEENPVTIFIKNDYKYRRAVEEARVLYVAMTRAKCELHVIAREKNVKEEHEFSLFSSAQRPSDFLARSDAECVIYPAGALSLVKNERKNKVISGEVNKELSSSIKDSLTYEYPYIKDTKIPLKTSVSSANNKDDEYYKTVNVFFESSAEKGTAYHKILELCNFDSDDLTGEVDRILTLNNFTKEQLSLIDKNKVLDILNITIFKTFKNSVVSKERKFCCLMDSSKLGYDSKEKVLVQGVIDLFLEDADGITLIDYKLSTIQKDEDLLRKYKTQMQLYKFAIETITGKRVKKVYILNILSGKLVELT